MTSSNLKHLLADSELLLNAVGEGIYGFDTQGHAVFINAAAERMTGWTAEELLGKSIHQYHHHTHADGTPYPAEECQIYATAQDGKSRQVTNEVFWRKDGSAFPVEYTSTPVFHQNKVIGAVTVFRDVTEQKNNEQALSLALDKVKSLSNQLQAENHYLQNELKQQWSQSSLTGSSLIMEKLKSQIQLVANTNTTVLILGENGTGKELAARELHQRSDRKKKAMIKVNCAAFTPSLLESELFGHEKGAFTGANESRKGKFELADKGTLFLDEIGELSLEAQSKLLRVIQEQEFERVGGNKTIKVDIRLIAATNKDLKAMVEQGDFRMDLYYRLNVFPIEMPPLRARKDDIATLTTQLIEQLNKKLNKQVHSISSSSLRSLRHYHWPGNVRELQNTLERAMILSQSPVLEVTVGEPITQTNHVKGKSLAQIEAQYILDVLNDCHWKIGGEQGAAKILGLPDSTLRSKMQKLNIKRP
ncbi:sigma 54-interacting transcriptional regulator [Thalassotalea sp. M1531]|uniref:Sigma 54-interacting transcriptional regulator n=1 Tax=Thalassotalea algicola TaxID=2716224 RepID=A0A7Y0LC15_9GAMM|nr:sigma 54-interacting transcriptional regulator [Thalassotalea algicola]NMP31815.1 sigma 54-interacting transcriptional regulator [Thalassotalea algicola]